MTPEALKLREIEAMELNAKAKLITGRSVLPQDLAAAYCGVSERLLQDLARNMEILAQKNGKFWYFRTKDLDRWMLDSDAVDLVEAKMDAKQRAKRRIL